MAKWQEKLTKLSKNSKIHFVRLQVCFITNLAQGLELKDSLFNGHILKKFLNVAS